MMMNSKRSRGEMEDNIAATLMLLSSKRGDQIDFRPVIQAQTVTTSTQSRVYECKTCNRQFSSFQALGGHTASHKKPKSGDKIPSDDDQSRQQIQVKKPRIHECSICGLEFSIGQALGGHMRRHRAAMIESASLASTTTLEVLSPSSSDITNDDTNPREKLQHWPVFKRSNSSRRILGLNLDLNLSSDLPSTNSKDGNDFEFSTLVAETKQMSTPSMIYSFI